MSSDPSMLAFAGVLLLAYTVQTVTGFGGGLICIVVGAHLLGIDEVIRLIVPLSFLQTGYIAIVHRDGIDWRLLIGRILPTMSFGMVIAFVFLKDVDSAWLAFLFGWIVLFLSIVELYKTRHPATDETRKPIGKEASMTAMLGAGVVHGIYATGGPLLVYALGREGLSKSAFRSTLCVVWIVLNIILFTRFFMAGDYESAVVGDFLLLTATVPLGIVAGEWVHRRVDEHRFQTVVYVLLVVAAISLILRYLPMLTSG